MSDLPGTVAAPAAAVARPPVVEIRGLRKRFGATQAVDGVDLTLRRGEIYGLVGTNGAGKSTLIRMLCGAVVPDGGSVRIDGVELPLGDPLAAQRAGIGAVQQEIGAGILPGHTVAENLALDRLADPASGLRYSAAATRQLAARIAERLELRLDLDVPIDRLGASERQQVLLARALWRDPRLLILDEPTSALSAREADHLFAAVRRLVEHGVTILYISHRIGEVAELVDRVGVLREGRLVRSLERPFSAGDIGTAMLGHAPMSAARDEAPAPGDPVLRLTGVQTRDHRPPLDLVLHDGEVTGIFGLLGAGKTSLFECLFGTRRFAAGEAVLDERPFAPPTPGEAIRRGVHLIPEDRGTHGVIGSWSIAENLSLPFLRRFERRGLLRPRLERRQAAEVMQRLGVVAPGPATRIGALSGGNQQKVIVGRWLRPEARLLLLDEPFRGIDLGARADIGQQIRAAAAGRAILIAASDIDELLEVADRIIVMRDGTIVGDGVAGHLSREQYAALAAGGAQ